MSGIERPSPQALPRRERIASRKDFLRAYDQGRKEYGRFAVLFVVPNESHHPRIGITVTRKAGKSHVRNRLRRWVREIYRRSREEAGLDGRGVDIVVNVKPSAAQSDFAAFAADLKKVLGRAARPIRT